MPRDPELEKLLNSTDQLLGNEENEPSQAAPSAEGEKAEGSSFMKSVVGLFIVQDNEAKTESTDTPPPSPNSVENIANSIPTPSFTVSSDDMASKDFKGIYSEAGISDAGFTVDKLNELLLDPTLKDQPLSTKTLVLKMALKAQNVTPDVPVTDAVKRDKALDAYQQTLNSRASQASVANEQKVQQIQDEVKKLLEAKNAEMDALRSESAELKRQAESFASRRLQEEQRLAEIVMPLLEGQPNPVSVGNKVD